MIYININVFIFTSRGWICEYFCTGHIDVCIGASMLISCSFTLDFNLRYKSVNEVLAGNLWRKCHSMPLRTVLIGVDTSDVKMIHLFDPIFSTPHFY